MNKILLLLVCLFLFQHFVAQKKDLSIVLYDKGNIELAKKKYRSADSLFTISLNFSPHPDTYFNRAVCRQKLNDFKGYCQDIGAAATYRDKEALNVYYKQCCKVDTIIFFNEGGNSKFDIKTIEFITKYTYNENMDYEKYDKDSTLLCSYSIFQKDTVYLSGFDVKTAAYGDNDSLLLDFIQKTKFADWVKTSHSRGGLTLSIIIDELGMVNDIKVIKTINNEFEIGLIKELRGLPKFVPASLSGRNVKFQKTLSIIFAGNLLYASTSEVGGKKLSRKVYAQKPSDNEVMPEFPGGVMEMMRFIQKNIKYPQIAKEASLSGKCFLRFIVAKDGTIKNVSVLRGVAGCIECDMESTRVVYAMPKWKPGTQNGKPVPVFFNLPINFQLR